MKCGTRPGVTVNECTWPTLEHHHTWASPTALALYVLPTVSTLFLLLLTHPPTHLTFNFWLYLIIFPPSGNPFTTDLTFNAHTQPPLARRSPGGWGQWNQGDWFQGVNKADIPGGGERTQILNVIVTVTMMSQVSGQVWGVMIWWCVCVFYFFVFLPMGTGHRTMVSLYPQFRFLIASSSSHVCL